MLPAFDVHLPADWLKLEGLLVSSAITRCRDKVVPLVKMYKPGFNHATHTPAPHHHEKKFQRCLWEVSTWGSSVVAHQKAQGSPMQEAYSSSKDMCGSGVWRHPVLGFLFIRHHNYSAPRVPLRPTTLITWVHITEWSEAHIFNLKKYRNTHHNVLQKILTDSLFARFIMTTGNSLQLM